MNEQNASVQAGKSCLPQISILKAEQHSCEWNNRQLKCQNDHTVFAFYSALYSSNICNMPSALSNITRCWCTSSPETEMGFAISHRKHQQSFVYLKRMWDQQLWAALWTHYPPVLSLNPELANDTARDQICALRGSNVNIKHHISLGPLLIREHQTFRSHDASGWPEIWSRWPKLQQSASPEGWIPWHYPDYKDVCSHLKGQIQKESRTESLWCSEKNNNNHALLTCAGLSQSCIPEKLKLWAIYWEPGQG